MKMATNGVRGVGRGLVLAGVLFATGAAHAIPSTSLSVTGDVLAPGSFDLSQLDALPQVTQTDTYTAGGTPVTDTFTGPSLWSVLNAAGGVKTTPGIKNDALRKVVIATGTDGYTAAVAIGEISPSFGNRPYLVATSDSAGQIASGGPQGFARLTAPGDKAGGRYVSNLESVRVADVSVPVSSTAGGVSTQFTLSGDVAHPGIFDLAALQALGSTTLTATYTAGGTPVTDTYTGVSVWNLLQAAGGVLTDPTIKNDLLRKVLVAIGSDGYETVISLGEISPQFGNQPDLIAYADTGGQLGVGGTSGFARLVVPGDTAGGRYVSNLVALMVIDVTDVPEPPAAGLLLAGLAALLLSRRRNAALLSTRRNAAT